MPGVSFGLAPPHSRHSTRQGGRGLVGSEHPEALGSLAVLPHSLPYGGLPGEIQPCTRGHLPRHNPLHSPLSCSSPIWDPHLAAAAPEAGGLVLGRPVRLVSGWSWPVGSPQNLHLECKVNSHSLSWKRVQGHRSCLLQLRGHENWVAPWRKLGRPAPYPFGPGPSGLEQSLLYSPRPKPCQSPRIWSRAREDGE